MNAVSQINAPSTATMKESIAAGGGIISVMAAKYHVEPLVLRDTIHNTIFDSKGTEAEFIAFLVVANEYKLNPLTREIYAFPKRGGGIVPVVSIDGWISLVNSHSQFKGMEFEPHTTEHGVLFAYTCRIWRKDREMPTAVTEYLDECIRSTDPWKMKNRMLRHKALIQCARYAFGFSGIYDDDEGAAIAEARAINPSSTTLPPAPPPPSNTDASGTKAEVEDATIVETKADTKEQAAQASTATSAAQISTDVSASDDTAQRQIDPNDVIANLLDCLAAATTADAINEGYDHLDVEAELSVFDGYVERARSIKAQQLGRVEKLIASQAKAADPALPAPPAASGLDNDAPPAPPATGSGLSTIDGYHAHLQKLLDDASTADGLAAIRAWWSETRQVRNDLDMPTEKRVELQGLFEKRKQALGL